VNRSKWQAIGILCLVFAFGVLTGGGALAAWHGEIRRDVAMFGFNPRGARPVLAMMRRLHLTHEQELAVETLLEKHAPVRHSIMQDMMNKCGQELDREKAQLDSEIRAIMTPEQRLRFDDLSKRQRERLFGPHSSRTH